MSYIQIVFSPTGGTERVANAITKNWPHLKKIDLSVPEDDFTQYSCAKEDVVLVAMPAFKGLAPQFALDRLSKIKGNAAKRTCISLWQSCLRRHSCPNGRRC